MTEPFRTRKDLARKLAWEGGILDGVEYGITTVQMPENDHELATAWGRLEEAVGAVEDAVKAVQELLPAEEFEL